VTTAVLLSAWNCRSQTQTAFFSKLKRTVRGAAERRQRTSPEACPQIAVLDQKNKNQKMRRFLS
jgi:hypothetical protein